MSEIIDISIPIREGMINYPGTAAVSIQTVASASGSAELSQISMTSHTGTHIDAPSHVIPGAPGMAAYPLDVFMGPCRVLDLTACEISISEADLTAHDISAGQRILLKTKNSERGFEDFRDDYIYLEPDAARFLGSIGVALVGIDALSVKQRGAEDNTAHIALLERSIPIIEGLNLAKVEAGEYTLNALPLSFGDLDGSPTRAVLIHE